MNPIKYTLKREESKEVEVFDLYQNGGIAQCHHAFRLCTSRCAQFEVIPKGTSVLFKEVDNRPVTASRDYVRLWCSGRVIEVGVDG